MDPDQGHVGLWLWSQGEEPSTHQPEMQFVRLPAIQARSKIENT